MMNKTIKFSFELVPLVKSGQKTSTWRLFDDKNLSEGDVVDFIARPNMEKFAVARLIKVVEKKLGNLTPEDKVGHEVFPNDKIMYDTYKNYYNRKVDQDTLVKIIWFEIVD